MTHKDALHNMPTFESRAGDIEAWKESCFKLAAINADLLEALDAALVHVQLLGSGQKPVNSNAEMCTVIGEAIQKARV